MKKSFKTWSIKILLILISLLYILFLYLDIFNKAIFVSSDSIKYISMIFIFIISLFIGDNSLDKKDRYLLQSGLFITLIADLFLLVLGNRYILGIFLFIIVQVIYSHRYSHKDLKSIIKNRIILFLSLYISYFLINKFIIKIEFLFFIGLFYGLCILLSAVDAYRAYKYKTFPSPNRQMIFIGMILFLLCDINVGLYNILSEINRVSIIYDISFVSMWLFYLPSQVLLALSGYDYKKI